MKVSYKIEEVYSKEAKMHKELEEFSYKFDKRFGGHTEFFSGVELEKILEIYENTI